MDFLPDEPIWREDMWLLEEFACATEAYFDAVKKLQQSSGEAEIFHAFELAELARRDCVAARQGVQRHREEHGCRVRGVPANA